MTPAACSELVYTMPASRGDAGTWMGDTLALVLAGGQGTRLGALTAQRAKPAVPIGKKYRIIDFVLSNCLNSRVPHVGVLTQYQSDSLVPHLEAWAANAVRHGTSIIALAGRPDRPYLGTADAIHQNRDIIRSLAPSHVLVLAADHVYRMDYAAMLRDHLQHGNPVTVGCVEVPLAEARYFGVMEVDGNDRVTAFAEKPRAPTAVPGRPDVALVSMGIYVFNTDFLLGALSEDHGDATSMHDFGKDVIPRAVGGAGVTAHRLQDIGGGTGQPVYWRDVGTIDAYWRTSLEIAARDGRTPDFDDPAWPIHGVAQPGRRTVAANEAGRSNSVICRGAHVARGAIVEDSVILPGARIRNGCVIRRAIVAEGSTIPPGTMIGLDPDRDREQFDVSPEGVVLAAARSAGSYTNRPLPSLSGIS